MSEDADIVRALLRHPFGDEALLDEALTHSSWSHEQGGPNNERLEFLGDAVLQLCVTAFLVARFPHAGEGEMSRLRQRFVNTKALADVARGLRLGPALRLGQGEAATGGRERPRVLAGATEAVLGAVFSDGGYEAAQRLVRRWIEDMLDVVEAEADTDYKDPRSRLQERVQRDLGATPVYDVVDRDGPPHAPVFDVAVSVGGRVLGQGRGSSKREAARRAAEAALSEREEAP
ncbi:MAG: ribonuclease III [Alphaproteobacteria bacterium]|nr:ribonuclease III [Alphaproteobacteria bacterium]MCB9698308.1 ribonuclease III [Alphaproteobacteria bacterium]